MDPSCKFVSILKDSRGIVVVIVAATTLVLLGITALSIDVGHVAATKTELQNVADGAVLAATRQLGVLYEPMSSEQQQTYVCNPATIVASAKAVASMNSASDVSSISINDADVIIGQWDTTANTFTPGLNQPDAVRVIARREAGANGEISNFFARIWGNNSTAVRADAIAALTAQSTAGPGDLEIPVGISKKWFEKPEFCNQDLKFYPTNTLEGCAGWHVYDSWPANAEKLETILEGLQSGAFQSPETAIDDSFVFTGGTLGTKAFDDMLALYNAKKDPITGKWETLVVVYDWDDCSNPNKDIKIVGFATAIVKNVLVTPEKTIIAEVKCENVEFGRGGGGNYGTKGSIPGLVE